MEMVEAPSHGHITGCARNSYEYVPDTGYVGDDRSPGERSSPQGPVAPE